MRLITNETFDTIGAEATYKNIWEAMMAMESQHKAYLRQFDRIRGISQGLIERVEAGRLEEAGIQPPRYEA